MIIFEAAAVCICAFLVVSHLVERIPAQSGMLLGVAAGLGFGISDVAIKALSGDLGAGLIGVLSPWSVIILTAAIFSFFASARSLQIATASRSSPSPRSRRTYPRSSPGWPSSATDWATAPSS